jgi:hypothetical protein
LPRNARRITGWANVILLAGLAMAGIVFADYDQWGRAAITYALFAFCLYFLGTAAYRLTLKSEGRVEAHSLLGLRTLDLREGFTVTRGVGAVVVKVGGRRCRVNPALGHAAVEEWLAAAQTGSTVSGRG